MKLKEKRTNGKSISTLLYVIAAIVAVLGIGMLSVNIYIFKSTISQYVAQGYPAEVVMQSLIPSQLLPGIFEPIALYGGIAFVLIGVGIANCKISQYIMGLTATETVEESITDENSQLADDTEYITQYAGLAEVEEDEVETVGLEDPIETEESAKNS